jgi:hypothetical protein
MVNKKLDTQGVKIGQGKIQRWLKKHGIFSRGFRHFN